MNPNQHTSNKEPTSITIIPEVITAAAVGVEVSESEHLPLDSNDALSHHYDQFLQFQQQLQQQTMNSDHGDDVGMSQGLTKNNEDIQVLDYGYSGNSVNDSTCVSYRTGTVNTNLDMNLNVMLTTPANENANDVTATNSNGTDMNMNASDSDNTTRNVVPYHSSYASVGHGTGTSTDTATNNIMYYHTHPGTDAYSQTATDHIDSTTNNSVMHQSQQIIQVPNYERNQQNDLEEESFLHTDNRQNRLFIDDEVEESNMDDDLSRKHHHHQHETIYNNEELSQQQQQQQQPTDEHSYFHHQHQYQSQLSFPYQPYDPSLMNYHQHYQPPPQNQYHEAMSHSSHLQQHQQLYHHDHHPQEIEDSSIHILPMNHYHHHSIENNETQQESIIAPMDLITNANDFITNDSNNDNIDASTTNHNKRKSKLSSEQAWNNKFEELYTFYQENGHADVPQTYKKNKSLGKWVGKQREHYKTYVELHKQQTWNDDNNTFCHDDSINDTDHNNVGDDGGDDGGDNYGNGDYQYTDYINHYQYNNNLDGNKYLTMNSKKTNANTAIRPIKKKTCPLTHERLSKLQSVNFKFVIGKGQHGTFTSSDTMIKAWEEKFKLLEEYKGIYGHVDVLLSTSSSSKTDDSMFMNNSSQQPQETALSILENQNDDVMQYDLYAENDSTNYTDISRTPIKHNVNNDSTTTSNKRFNDYQMKSLGRWLQSQKKKYKETKQEILSTNVILKDRFQRLIDIGVDLECGENNNNDVSFDCIDTIIHGDNRGDNHHNANRHRNLWYTRYSQLCEFKDKFGHPNVSSQNCESNSQLVRWVATQRGLWKARQKQSEGHSIEKKNITLSDEKIALLNKIGFEFSIYDKTFHNRLNELKMYKEQHGHIDVRALDNKSLYDWIHRQRSLFRDYMEGNAKHRSSMTNERITLLEEIGFDWNYSFEAMDREKVRAAVASASMDQNSRNRLERSGKCKSDRADEPQEMRTNVSLHDKTNLESSSNRLERSGKCKSDRADEPQEMRTNVSLHDTTNLESSSNRISDLWNESDTMLDGNGTIPFRDNISSLNDGDGLCLSPQSTGQHKKGTKPHLWKQNYDALVAFQKETGHCRVPGKYNSNPKLGYWVKLQREGK